MPLTNIQAKQAKPREKNYKLSDSGGLYLEVTTKGHRYWRLKYRFNGKEKRLAIGVYPAVSLKDARNARDTAKELLAQGTDPSQQKQADKFKQQICADNTFEKIGRLWIERKSHEWSKTHTEDVTRSLDINIFPSLGHFPITEITPPMLTKVLNSVQNRGSLETAKRLRQRCSGIFRFGIAGGICENDPAEYLKDVLKKPKSSNLPALPPEELPEYLAAIKSCNMTLQTRLAINLMTLTFVRNTELREATWKEIDIDNSLWTIPAYRMKKKDQGDHLVPLSVQAIKAINQLHTITGHREHLFPQARNPKKPMSDGAITAVIQRIGYKGRMTVHGYRSVASTILNESGRFNPDAIERQLHHKEKNEIRGAYNRAEYMSERQEMMQWWSDYIDLQQ